MVARKYLGKTLKMTVAYAHRHLWMGEVGMEMLAVLLSVFLFFKPTLEWHEGKKSKIIYVHIVGSRRTKLITFSHINVQRSYSTFMMFQGVYCIFDNSPRFTLLSKQNSQDSTANGITPNLLL